MTKPKHVWVVRAGNDNELAELVEEKDAVAIGWSATGDLSGLKKRLEVKNRIKETHPEFSKHRIAINGGQLFRFSSELQFGDYVLTYDQSSREIIIGVAKDEYEFNPGLFSERYPHVRRVEWIRRVSRDDFTTPAKNSLGSSLTVFKIDDHLDEVHALATKSKPDIQVEEEEEEAPLFFEDVRAKAEELISDKVSRLDPYEFQYLVAGVLKAMGFQAFSSKPGRDRGVDIVAYPDSLGFERPRVKVQVKHRKGKVSGPEMRAFLGVLKAGDNGLYVSTSGFKSDAVLEAEGAQEKVTLLDRDRFIRLMLENYENLEPEFQALIPLRRVWLPAE